MKIVIALNTAWNLVNFRSGLIRALIAQGYEVVAVAPYDDHAPLLANLGCRYIEVPMDNRGTNPLRDVLLFWRFWKLFRRERPDCYLGYTVKPNVYGSLAAHCFGIPVVNNIAGLGSAFISKNWLTGIVRLLYKFALRSSWKVFFQNQDDRKLFVETNLVRQERTALLPGSGVDLSRFYLAPPKRTPSLEKSGEPQFRFLLIARMLWDKGVAEFVEAARNIRLKRPDVEFCLLGFTDVENPSAISREQIDSWAAEGCIRYLGAINDVRQNIEHAHCVVLPSYREGTPRSLLEAAAMGRPIISTNAVGCRDVVDDGINGFLCKVRDSRDLAEKMLRMLELTVERRNEMGMQGRKKMELQYDERIVIEKYIAEIRSLVQAV